MIMVKIIYSAIKIISNFGLQGSGICGPTDSLQYTC